MRDLYKFNRKLQALEVLLLPREEKPKGPTLDYSLFTPKERDISDTIHLFHDIAVRLGHGTLRACRYRIPIEHDPNSREEAREEALRDATPKEFERIELERVIMLKWIRLTPLLTEEEKDIIKRYNKLATIDKFSKPPYSGSVKPNLEEFREARLLYNQIMAKHNAENYEDHPMKPYIAGSGIPMKLMRKMDVTFANALEVKLHA